MKGCEFVIHEAAIPTPVSDKFYTDYFKTNVEGIFNVAKAAEETGVKRVIYASSTTIYGIERGIPYGPIDKVMTGAYVSLENVIQATKLAVESNREFWYEPFSIVDRDVEFISIEKARIMLGYDPAPAEYDESVNIKPFQSRIELDNRYSTKY